MEGKIQQHYTQRCENKLFFNLLAITVIEENF
jgi:hypothetical protein